MKPRKLTASAGMIVLTVLTVLGAALIAGCGQTVSNGFNEPVTLTISDVTIPQTATAGQPITYTATVHITNTKQQFLRFGYVRATNPYTVAALGDQASGGTPIDRTETHTGTLTFPQPGTYKVDFAQSEPPVSVTITVQ